MSQLRVLICLIGTGKYAELLNKQYIDIKSHFLPTIKKDFIVFSDIKFDAEDVLYIKMEHNEWPSIVLKRFITLNKYVDYIKSYDWFIFLDADIDILEVVSEEEFFCHNKSFFGVAHPTLAHNGSFSDDVRCRAYVGKNEDRSMYWQACFWGGKGEFIIHLISKISEDLSFDASKNIIAKWHEESYLNRFFINNKKDVYTYNSSKRDLGRHYLLNKKLLHKNFQWLTRKGKPLQ